MISTGAGPVPGANGLQQGEKIDWSLRVNTAQDFARMLDASGQAAEPKADATDPRADTAKKENIEKRTRRGDRAGSAPDADDVAAAELATRGDAKPVVQQAEQRARSDEAETEGTRAEEAGVRGDRAAGRAGGDDAGGRRVAASGADGQATRTGEQSQAAPQVSAASPGGGPARSDANRINAGAAGTNRAPQEGPRVGEGAAGVPGVAGGRATGTDGQSAGQSSGQQSRPDGAAAGKAASGGKVINGLESLSSSGLMRRAATRQQPAGNAGAEPGGATLKAEQEQRLAAQAVRGMSAALRQGGGVVTLRLTPDSLGTLRIKLDVAGSAVQARIEASSAEARRLLEAELPTLRGAMEARGLTLENVSVSVRSPEAASAQRVHEAPGTSESPNAGLGSHGTGAGSTDGAAPDADGAFGGGGLAGGERHPGDGWSAEPATGVQAWRGTEAQLENVDPGSAIAGVVTLRIDAVA